MLSRQENGISGTILVRPCEKAFFLEPPLWALIVFGLISFGSTTGACAQETPKLQTQTGTSSADQAPSVPSKMPGEALYNLLEKKSIVFPDIAASTERLSTGQKFKLFVDNSVSVTRRHGRCWVRRSARRKTLPPASEKSGVDMASDLGPPWRARRPAISSGRLCLRPRCIRIRVFILRSVRAFSMP